jgi:hypothetical protein
MYHFPFLRDPRRAGDGFLPAPPVKITLLKALRQ